LLLLLRRLLFKLLFPVPRLLHSRLLLLLCARRLLVVLLSLGCLLW
jgi:hypothetical protein